MRHSIGDGTETTTLFGAAQRRPIQLMIAATILAAGTLAASGQNAQTPITQVAVYTLSKGRGVSKDATDAVDKVRDYFTQLFKSGAIDRIEEVRIGLEGESRLCVNFLIQERALEGLEHVKELTHNIEQISVRQPCAEQK